MYGSGVGSSSASPTRAGVTPVFSSRTSNNVSPVHTRTGSNRSSLRNDRPSVASQRNELFARPSATSPTSVSSTAHPRIDPDQLPGTVKITTPNPYEAASSHGVSADPRDPAHAAYHPPSYHDDLPPAYHTLAGDASPAKSPTRIPAEGDDVDKNEDDTQQPISHILPLVHHANPSAPHESELTDSHSSSRQNQDMTTTTTTTTTNDSTNEALDELEQSSDFC